MWFFVSKSELIMPTASPALYQLLPHEALQTLLQKTPTNPWPTIDDRAAWDKAAQTPLGASIKETVLQKAAEFANTGAVPLPTLGEYLAFSRTGDRQAWQNRKALVDARLNAFALAACFTGEPMWIEQTANALWSLCEVSAWTIPAHEQGSMPDIENPTIDLGVAMDAVRVAEILQILGPAFDRIHPRIKKRSMDELSRRVFDPFLARGDWWWLWRQPGRSRLNNWLAVCSGGVLVAALAVLSDDPDKQARIVHKAAWSLQFFKTTFDEAGSLDEGAGYWSYGVSYFVLAAERLAARTNGQSDPLADPIWQNVARFPLRARLYNNTFVNFSDCAPQVTPSPGWLAYLGRHLDVPELQEWAARMTTRPSLGSEGLPFTLRSLFWLPTTNPAAATNAAESLPLSTFLPDVQWLVARAKPTGDALVLAAKGGHNAENHNHNDVGSFIVHFQNEPLIAELGAPTYTRQFFGPDRYENIAARSLGHSVPYVNGHEQEAGRQFAARVVEQSSGVLELDLTAAYPPSAGLVSLTRRLVLNPDTAQILLSDHAQFKDDGAAFALPLLTLDAVLEVADTPGRATITGKKGRLVITWNGEQATCKTETVSTTDPKFLNANQETRIARLWFDIAVQNRDAHLELTFTPEKSNP